MIQRPAIAFVTNHDQIGRIGEGIENEKHILIGEVQASI
jgi:hypothetical protein